MDNIRLISQNISTTYKKFKISHVNFKLESGDILGIVGRSGSGKSTLIKTLIGEKKKTSGKITAFKNNNKINISNILGYSPQENSLYPYLTLKENIETFGKLYNMNQEQIKKRTKFLLERLNLKNSINKKINQLSGGMQKRADLAIALIHSPQLIVLDEPFNGLDISLQKFIWDLLKELSKEGNIIIISSHMLNDIQKHCNQFGLVEKGYYYDTKQVIDTIKRFKETNLENFLQKLFTQT